MHMRVCVDTHTRARGVSCGWMHTWYAWRVCLWCLRGTHAVQGTLDARVRHRTFVRVGVRADIHVCARCVLLAGPSRELAAGRKHGRFHTEKVTTDILNA